MTLDSNQTAAAPPPFSLTAAGPASDAAPARAEVPDDTDFGTDTGYMFGQDGFTFADFLDIINPLQHLPVVSTLYRAVTGDTIDPGSRMIGGTLFGGPTGFAAAVVNNAMVDHSGKDLGDTVLAAILPEPSDPAPDTTVALAAGDSDAQSAETLATDLSAAAQSEAPAAPWGLQDGDRPVAPLLPATGLSPVLTAESNAPLIDRTPRTVSFPSGAATPRDEPLAEPRPRPRPSTQVAAMEEADRVRKRPDAPQPTRTDDAPAPASRPVTYSPTPLDPSLIPQAMLSALEKYEQMKRGS